MRSDLNTTPQFSDALHVRGGLSALKWLIVLGIINLYDMGQSDCFTVFLGESKVHSNTSYSTP